MKSLYPAKLPSGQWQLPGQQQRSSPCCPQPGTQGHWADGMECRLTQLQRQTPHSLAFRLHRAHGAATVHWGVKAFRRAQLPVSPRALPGRTQLVWAMIHHWGYACVLPSGISLTQPAEEAPHSPQFCHSLVTGQERYHAVFSGTENLLQQMHDMPQVEGCQIPAKRSQQPIAAQEPVTNVF